MIQSQEQNNVDGFESQIGEDQLELDAQNQFHDTDAKDEQDSSNCMPPGRSIVTTKYSLYPDIVTGWNGNQKVSHPIPITVEAPYFDRLIYSVFHKTDNSDLKVCYLGPRYDNSFFAWFKMPFQFPYSHLQPPTNMKFTNRVFVGQSAEAEQQVIFDSFFQSSNLDCVIKVGEKEYDLYLRVDSNTRGHFQWFNFTIKNLEPNATYKLNICNLQRDFTLYSRGMKPYVLSNKAKQKIGKDWEQQGQNIKYQKKASKSLSYMDPKCKNFYQLSFEISTKYDDDTLQIAYCIPYTYSDLITFLKNLKKKVGQKIFYSETRLCKSLGGIPIPLITVTEQLNEDVDNKLRKFKKKCIVIVARVHPGESNSSFFIQGLLNFICSNNKYARHLRSHILFKIVPMINPDGVSFGNFRTGISGKDFNREYLKPDPAIFPEIYNIKKLVIDYKKKYAQNFMMFVDCHGHTSKKNIFMYGPQFSLTDRMYYQSRILPRMLSKQTKMFRYYSCIFKVQTDKKSTARAVFMQLHNIPISYTLEISNFCYYDTQQLCNVVFTAKNWLQMGAEFGFGIAQYLSLLHTTQILRLQKYKKRQLEKLNLQKKVKKNIPAQKKNERKKNGSMQVRVGYGRISYKEEEQQDDLDLMNYIYQQINKAQSERKKYFQNQKKQIFGDHQEDKDSESDCDSPDNDLQEEKINLLYRFIKKKQSGPKFQAQLQKQMQSSKNDMGSIVLNEKKISKYTHRRAQSVGMNRRNSRQKNLLLTTSPQKINIGAEINHQKSSFPVGDKRFPPFPRQIKQKRKTFEQFILQNKNIKKSISGKKMSPKKKCFELFELQSEWTDNREGSPIIQKKGHNALDSLSLSTTPKDVQTKLKNFEQKKLQIYHRMQQRKKESIYNSDNNWPRQLETLSPTKLKQL